MSDSLPSPPFIEISGIANFRDLGDSQTFRNGWVFRSADPSKATPEGLEKMSKDLGIKLIFDLRSSPEIKRDGPEWAGLAVDKTDIYEPYGMKREWVPVFADADYSPEQIALRYKEYARSGTTGFVEAYRAILQHAPTAYGRIFRHLAEKSAAPCLVHCTAGKDRTGVLVALLFLLAGMDKEKIADEYALTDLGLAALKPVFQERLLKNPALEGNREGVLNMTSSKRENMLASIEMIEKDFGGAEKYLKEYCKMSDEEIQAIRANLTHMGHEKS